MKRTSIRLNTADIKDSSTIGLNFGIDKSDSFHILCLPLSITPHQIVTKLADDQKVNSYLAMVVKLLIRLTKDFDPDDEILEAILDE